MTPRLKELYYKEIQPALKEKLGFKNTYQGPRVIKIVINMVKKHVKTTKEKKGGIVSKESFIHLSNLKLIDEKAAKKTEAKK